MAYFSAMDQELGPLWENLDWAIGQMLLMGWDGTEVTPQIRNLIEEHHLGSIILTAKNLKSAEQTTALVRELQTIAHDAGHPYPLLIALDQENGGVNSLFDEDYISQFPSAMGIAATGNLDLAYEVAKATATELSSVGVNVIMGPVLDVLINARNQPLGVRSSGDDPQEVSQYGMAAMNGYKDAGVATCGKHFPSYGNLDFPGSSSLDMPIITQTLEELSINAFVPFRNAIQTGRLDAMFVGGVRITNSEMNVMHACLSDQVVDKILRRDLGFTGVSISECLEMQSLIQEYGVKGGTVRAVEAGNDLVLLCRCHDVQLEAISGLKLGIENNILTKNRVHTSLRRVLKMKRACTSWEKALKPQGSSLLAQIHPSNLVLSKQAYEQSITVVRDSPHLLPLNQSLLPEEELLLLTPLVKPLPATKNQMEKVVASDRGPANNFCEKWALQERGAIMSGEGVFKELGRALARARHGKLLHTSYTANGVRPVHENLINRASAIVIVTADAHRNMYQIGFTKYVSMMCQLLRTAGQKKPLIVVAVSSPYDFSMDINISTYVCIYDFTEAAMVSLVRALYGEFDPKGSIPGTMRKRNKVVKNRQHWLVEAYDPERDSQSLNDLLKSIARSSSSSSYVVHCTASSAKSFEAPDQNTEESHFVVRNSSTKALYGFVATYFAHGIGAIGALFVDPSKRNASIGQCLHQRAIKALLQRPDVTKVQLGWSFPAVFPGIPVEDQGVVDWFKNMGWSLGQQQQQAAVRRVTNMIIRNITAWAPPKDIVATVHGSHLKFDSISGADNADAEAVLNLVTAHAAHPSIIDLYRFVLTEKGNFAVIFARIDDSGSSDNPNYEECAPRGIIGSVIICRELSALTTYIPILDQPDAGPVGGVLAPTVFPSARQSTVLQALVFMGARQNKYHKMAWSVLGLVPDECSAIFSSLGYEKLEAFDEVAELPRNWPDLV